MKDVAIQIPLVALLLSAFTTPVTRADEAKDTTTGSIAPIVRYVHVDGDEKRFRQDWWIQDGWAGGVDELTVDRQLGGDWKLAFDARAIFDEEDYKLRLEIVNPEVGFLRAGYTEYRKYFDDSGGFYPRFTIPSFQLDRDLHLALGAFTIDVGLTLPNWPKIVLGYEHNFKDGAKSLLQWGSVVQTLSTNAVTPVGAVRVPAGSLPVGPTTRKIFPASKDMDERVDIFKIDIDHSIGNVNFGDQFRYENYRSDTTVLEKRELNLTTGTNRNVTVHERFTHDAFSNVFHMDSHVNEKVYWSLGYLFSTLSGEAAIRLDSVPFAGLFAKNWFSRAIEFDQDSHVVNVNTMFGPWKGLSLYGGLQAEKTETDAEADVVLTEILPGLGAVSPEAVINSRNNKESFEETVGVRFTRIAYTTLYAEGKWTQQDIGLFEREIEEGDAVLDRFTDTDIHRQQYSVGFNTSPIKRLTLSARYRYSVRDNDYDHLTDNVDGYSAFINAQKLTTDSITAKLTVRPLSRLSLSLNYQLVATDIDTAHGASAGGPAGTLQSGNYDANIYSASATVTPISRLYLTGLFSYYDTRTIAFDNNSRAILAHQGDVYTVIATVGYALDEKTDVRVQYSYSRADNFRNNGFSDSPPAGLTPPVNNNDFGLPLGISNQRHALMASLDRRLTENVLARLSYGFYELDEASTGGFNDYTAHLASASCSVRF